MFLVGYSFFCVGLCNFPVYLYMGLTSFLVSIEYHKKAAISIRKMPEKGKVFLYKTQKCA